MFSMSFPSFYIFVTQILITHRRAYAFGYWYLHISKGRKKKKKYDKLYYRLMITIRDNNNKIIMAIKFIYNKRRAL